MKPIDELILKYGVEVTIKFNPHGEYVKKDVFKAYRLVLTPTDGKDCLTNEILEFTGITVKECMKEAVKTLQGIERKQVQSKAIKQGYESLSPDEKEILATTNLSPVL